MYHQHIYMARIGNCNGVKPCIYIEGLRDFNNVSTCIFGIGWNSYVVRSPGIIRTPIIFFVCHSKNFCTWQKKKPPTILPVERDVIVTVIVLHII